MVRTSEEALVDSFDDCLQLSVNKVLSEGKEWIRLWRLMKLESMREADNSGVDVDTEMEDAFVGSTRPLQRPVISLKRKREALVGSVVTDKQMKTTGGLSLDRTFTRTAE